jgi:1,4-alpha-glucan branching enzyme
MNKRRVISILLNVHLPFVSPPGRSQPPEEQWFFESLSETCLPLLEVFDRLDADHVPFRAALSFSPTLCNMLEDPALRDRYLDYTDRQIEFGRREIERASGDPALEALARFYYDRAVDRRVLFTERYGGNILGVFHHYQKKGRLELLTTAATYAFLPFYGSSPEALQAQFEVALTSHRHCFGRVPQGFWLPELGWSGELEGCLRAYNFAYTVVEPHALFSGDSTPRRGTFFPVKTPGGIYILGRDFYAGEDLARMARHGLYRDNGKDAGYELSADLVRPFLDSRGGRGRTGFKYWAAGEPAPSPGEGEEAGQRRDGKVPYDPRKAGDQAARHAREFLEARIARLARAEERLQGPALSLCAWDADRFGRRWYEGPEFIERLFREGARRPEVQFMTPSEFLFKQDIPSFQTLTPGFSSRGLNGYGEPWLDASNDWMYRHLIRSQERMIELAERFPDDSGLKERALNQAAREVLLAQASDWAKMLSGQESPDYARAQVEMSLRNFTTIYEALGSNYISTEWLTDLERRHNIFPHINYRVFRRKR